MLINEAKFKINNLFPGYIKENGVKTDKPLMTADGKRVYWLSLTAFPQGSTGGDDQEMFAMCTSETEPITLAYREKPLVELINPQIDLENGRLSLMVDGVKRIANPAKRG